MPNTNKKGSDHFVVENVHRTQTSVPVSIIVKSLPEKRERIVVRRERHVIQSESKFQRLTLYEKCTISKIDIITFRHNYYHEATF